MQLLHEELKMFYRSRKFWFLASIFLLISLACNLPVQSPVRVDEDVYVFNGEVFIGEVTQVGRLESLITRVCHQLTLDEDIVLVFFGEEINASGWVGESSSIYACTEVIIGVDLEKITSSSVGQNENEITLSIPVAEVFLVDVIPDTLVINNNDGWLASLDGDDVNEAELMSALEQAVWELVESSEDLMFLAQENAKTTLHDLLSEVLPDDYILTITSP
ncbi:DUF4230 domain-containing protein [Patescibacteria group bacterium]